MESFCHELPEDLLTDLSGYGTDEVSMIQVRDLLNGEMDKGIHIYSYNHGVVTIDATELIMLRCTDICIASEYVVSEPISVIADMDAIEGTCVVVDTVVAMAKINELIMNEYTINTVGLMGTHVIDRVGPIAQEVETTSLAGIVHDSPCLRSDDGMRPLKAVNMHNVMGYLITAVQGIDARLAAIEALP